MKKKTFLDPNIEHKSKTVENRIQLFEYKNKQFPLPTEIEISESGTCNRKCSFCPRRAPDFSDIKEFISEDLVKKVVKEKKKKKRPPMAAPPSVPTSATPKIAKKPPMTAPPSAPIFQHNKTEQKPAQGLGSCRVWPFPGLHGQDAVFLLDRSEPEECADRP